MFDELQRMCLTLPEAARVDIAAWDDQPTFRVRGKNFVFADAAGTKVTLKLSDEEATWVADNIDGASRARYGLGKHGWVSIPLPQDVEQLREWVLESYCLVAPKTLARRIAELR